MLGPLQGDPDPDVARISVTIHENDPDKFYGINQTLSGDWEDEVEETECGGAITWRRRFTVKARCLLVNTQENVTTARSIASTIRKRIETTLLQMSFRDIQDDDEYVSRGVFSENIHSEMIQAGGPEAYDFHIKIRFEVLTTRGVTL